MTVVVADVIPSCSRLADQSGSPPLPRIRSPKTLLFGAVSEVVGPSEEGAARRTGPSGDTVASEMPTAYQVGHVYRV
ncbi:Treslin [Myotis davidii]|uniref:Treslin n=1 Tax=Myotis davidii TaxID=225400 RepID=L5LRV2_MYODS|nr:Treslin [Myotis davidii]